MSDFIIPILNRKQILALPKPHWLVDGIIQKPSLACIYGYAGVGKSLSVLDIAASVATGRPWMGRRVEQGQVLIFTGEGHSGISTRVQAWEAYYKEEVEGLHYIIEPIPLDAQKMYTSILHHGLEPSLIIVDTISNTIEGDENVPHDMGVYLQQMTFLSDACKAAVMAVHHPGWTVETRPRGASNLAPTVDTLILAKKNGDGHGVLQCQKQKEGEQFPDIYYKLEEVDIGEPKTARVVAPEFNGKLQPSPVDDELLIKLKSKPLTTTELRTMTPEMSKATFYRKLRGLTSQGIIHVDKFGKLSIPEESQA